MGVFFASHIKINVIDRVTGAFGPALPFPQLGGLDNYQLETRPSAHVAPAVLLPAVGRHFGRCCPTRSLIVSICFFSRVHTAAGWAAASAEFSTETSSLRRVGWDFFVLCECVFALPRKSKWNDWCLRRLGAGPGLVSQPTGLWVWLTCLRRRRTGMGVGGRRDMDFWTVEKMNRSVFLSVDSRHHSSLLGESHKKHVMEK